MARPDYNQKHLDDFLRRHPEMRGHPPMLESPHPEIRSESAERLGHPGFVSVWDEHGRIVGCMGVELWRALLIARVELFIPESGDPRRLSLRQHDVDLRIAQPRHVRAESACTDNGVTKSD